MPKKLRTQADRIRDRIKYRSDGLALINYRLEELENEIAGNQAEIESYQPEKNRLEAEIKQLQSDLDNPPPNQET